MKESDVEACVGSRRKQQENGKNRAGKVLGVSGAEGEQMWRGS